MKRTLLLLSSLLMFSCSNAESPKDADAIVVNFELTAAPQYTVLDTIRLETRDDALLGGHFRLLANDQYYVISDQSKVVVFYKDGKIRSAFDPRGRSRKEVYSLYYTILTDDYIEIANTATYRAVRYDFDGKFIEELPLPEQTMEYVYIGDMIVLDRQAFEDKPLSIYTVGSDNPSLLALNTIAKGMTYGMGSKFSFDKGELFYLPSFYEKVYNISTDGQVEVAYTFDFGRYGLNEEEIMANLNIKQAPAFYEYLKNEQKVRYLRFKKWNDWIILSFSYSSANNNYWFYNEADSSQYMVDDSQKILGKSSLVDDHGALISLYEAYDYLETFGEDGIVTENSNPVIIRYTLD